MRVRISYGADIEEVPQELQKLFLFVSDKTQTVLRQMRQVEELLTDEDVESTINLMDKLRLNLAEIDNRIADVVNIASGYVNYKENEGVDHVEQGRPGVDTTEERPPDRDAKQSTGNPHHAGT